MQPTRDQPQQHANPFDTGMWTGSSYPPQTVTVKKARPWLVALVALLTLFVLIAGLANQWVINAISKHSTGNTFGDHVVQSDAAYAWRFSPKGSSDFGHVWLADLCLVLAALVLTFLLVAAICRGNGGFGQVFLGTWASVVAATIVGGYVRASVIDTQEYVGQHLSKANAIFFSPVSPGAMLIAAALGFGFVVAIFAALTALLSRRKDEVVPAPALAPALAAAPAEAQDARAAQPQQPSSPPWNAPPAAGVPGPVSAPSPWSENREPQVRNPHQVESERTVEQTPDERAGNTVDETADETAEVPRQDVEPTAQSEQPAQHTAVLPTVDAPSGDAPSGESETTQLPRSDWGEDTQHTTQLPRTDDADGDGEGPRHLSE